MRRLAGALVNALAGGGRVRERGCRAADAAESELAARFCADLQVVTGRPSALAGYLIGHHRFRREFLWEGEGETGSGPGSRTGAVPSEHAGWKSS